MKQFSNRSFMYAGIIGATLGLIIWAPPINVIFWLASFILAMLSFLAVPYSTFAIGLLGRSLVTAIILFALSIIFLRYWGKRKKLLP